MPLKPGEKLESYGLIDITVSYFALNNMWYTSALAHRNPPPGDDSPEEYGDSEEYRGRIEAIQGAEAWAENIINDGDCLYVVIFVEGSEHKVIDRRPRQE